MPWYSKEQLTPFDNITLDGMLFLSGDVLARQYRQEWVKGQTYPVVQFPSGMVRELKPGKPDSPPDFIHLTGHLMLPYRASRDGAYFHLVAQDVDEEHLILLRGETELSIDTKASGRRIQVTYDPATGHPLDIRHFPEYVMELLPGELRALLPKLYANEKLGLEAVALLKFFTPDSNWTWYPTEYDGDDVFFGLVSGFDVELGYFSLSELESVLGRLNLPIERELYFKPTTLRELKQYHEQL